MARIAFQTIVGLIVFSLSADSIVAEEAAKAAGPPLVDFRDERGNLIISADQIVSYDWGNHTFKLKDAAAETLAASLLEGKRLVSGVPFALCVDGEPIYEGVFTTSVSSKSITAPAIVFAGGLAAGRSELLIQLGYPSEKYFKGEDPRGDKRIREALDAAGKLINLREDRIQWIAAALHEMQRITAGMTRGELLEVFVEEGGVSNRLQRRYAYRDCPYIKVDVRFEAVEKPDDKTTEVKTDKIMRVSKPFLEWPIAD